jgi:hypothetical protein
VAVDLPSRAGQVTPERRGVGANRIVGGAKTAVVAPMDGRGGLTGGQEREITRPSGSNDLAARTPTSTSGLSSL